jgi:hypothetical protein
LCHTPIPILLNKFAGRLETILAKESNNPTAGGHKEMSSILADQWRSHEPKCWGTGGGGVAGPQPTSTAVHIEEEEEKKKGRQEERKGGRKEGTEE